MTEREARQLAESVADEVIKGEYENVGLAYTTADKVIDALYRAGLFNS